MRLALKFEAVRIEFELANAPTARALMEALPFESEPGTVCFWCEGDALALPYGRTPISTDERLAGVEPGEKVKVESA